MSNNIPILRCLDPKFGSFTVRPCFRLKRTVCNKMERKDTLFIHFSMYFHITLFSCTYIITRHSEL